jgi:hypothetical protein
VINTTTATPWLNNDSSAIGFNYLDSLAVSRMLKTAIGSVGDISAPKKHSVNKVYIDPIKFSK